MASRGQKRAEVVDEMPADKRACSSLEFRPSTSNSSAQAPMSPPHETPEADMDTSSSTSASTRSEGDGERDSTYGSCDSENSLRDYYRHRSSNDQSKFKKVLSSLTEESEESVQLALLTELCELLSFCSDNSLPSLMADSFSPVLVGLSRHESNPDIMLLSVRAITYLCDVNPRSSGFLVRHDAVPALCQRLVAIEYLDVAEQCLQALEKISREQPLACLQSGAIMAVLSYIDFFSTSVQRVALSTVVNICKKLSSEAPSLFMEAVPILCNLLQYEDRQLIESVATCLINIGEQVYQSPDMLDEICNHGLVQQVLHLIGVNSRTTLCQPTYVGLIGLLVKFAAGSTFAFKTLFELNISKSLKDILTTYELSHGVQSVQLVDGHQNQMHEVLKLLNELLPTIILEEDTQPKSEKETFLLSHPDMIQNFGYDLLPILIQIVSSGVTLSVCYGCLTVITKLVDFCKPDALHGLLQAVNFPSFLAGVFTRKDHHVILLALQMVDSIMLKLPHVFLNSFIKEGVLFAIYALISPDKDLKLSQVFDCMLLESNAMEKSASRDVHRCPCAVFDRCQSSKSAEDRTCKLQNDTVQNLAKRIWTCYFETESVNPEKGVTDILQRLKTLSSALTELVDKSLKDVALTQLEEEIDNYLHKIISELNKKDSISTFEFAESGTIKAFVHYLSNGSYLPGGQDCNAANHLDIMEKRFEVFGQSLLSCSPYAQEDFPLLNLTRRLQSALSSAENFPVISSQLKYKSSYATVPYGHCTSYPCLKVHFAREKEETSLNDYTEDVVNVDPFLPICEVEGYLWPRVNNVKTSQLSSGSEDLEQDSPRSYSPSGTCTSQCKGPEVISSREMLVEIHKNFVEEEENGSLQNDGWTAAYRDNTSQKLIFYLEGHQLNHDLTLYQSIFKQRETETDDIPSDNLWTRIYRITYKRHVLTKSSLSWHSRDKDQHSLSPERTSFLQYMPFFSCMFVSEADLEKLGLTYDILSLLKCLDGINRLRCHVISRVKTHAFAEGRMDDLDKLNVTVYGVPQHEFVNCKLTEKLEQQMRKPTFVSLGALPSWCTQLMAWCPFLFGFEARLKFFHLAALGRLPVQIRTLSQSDTGGSASRQRNHRSSPRKKFLVHRNKILESASQMMELHARQKVILEVEYNEEVGTGLGPTLEFYTLVSREFQRGGLGMWRDDYNLECDNAGFLVSSCGLFPRPWSHNSHMHSEVNKKFALLGQIVAKALQDGRVLDLPFSKAFYKLIQGKELTMFDIQSFDPAFGRALLEFQAIVERKRHLKSVCGEAHDVNICFWDIKFEDLCLHFTLPGYPDYHLVSSSVSDMVNHHNLEEYVTLMVDATIKSGISQQVEAFKSGFDQVFPIRHLAVFTEEELERLLCGEHELWKPDELMDHIKFDHGYTISSPAILNFLEIMQELDREQQRAFVQFVTGAPRLPTGGLASLSPKLTIVRKHCSGIDADLPSVMTCANYLKLPPYSSKEIMKEKLLYAITEGQGSFHLS